MRKLSLVFKGMLNEIVIRRPSLLHKARVVDYNINDMHVVLIITQDE